ncbi:MAG: hypothetical protein AB2421_05680 [Thermotaleaceae bacterium]
MKCLWVEDFDKGTTPELEKFWRELYQLPGDYDLVLKRTLPAALEYLHDLQNDFDCVIIDIHLSCEDGVLGTSYKSYLEKVVSESFINKDRREIEKAGGFFVFLKLLLERGFPRDRMAFLTGNYSEDDGKNEVLQELLEIMENGPMVATAEAYVKTLDTAEREEIQSLMEELANFYHQKEDEIFEKYEEENGENFIAYLKHLAEEKVDKSSANMAQNTYNEYKALFEKAGISPSKPYIKEGQEEKTTLSIKRHTRRLKKWLKRMDSEYYRLRRSMIEICDGLLGLLEGRKDMGIEANSGLYIFNRIQNINHEEAYDIKEIINMLTLLKELLPFKEPSEIQKKKLYTQVLRTLSHYWETKTAFYPSTFSKEEYYKNFYCVMKILRNWMAHSKINEASVTEANVGFFFILAMRTYFDLGYEVDKNNPLLKKIGYYERKLLELHHNKVGIGELINYFKFYPADKGNGIRRSKFEEILKLSFTEITKKEMSSFKKAYEGKDNISYNVYAKMKNIGDKDSQIEATIEDLYKLFWHSIFYSRLEGYHQHAEDLTQLVIRFTFSGDKTWLKEEEILTQLFIHTFYPTFSREIEKLKEKREIRIKDTVIS